MATDSSSSSRHVPLIDANRIECGNPLPARETSTPPNCASPAAQEQAPAVTPTDMSSAYRLLGALWRSPDRYHQFGTLDRRTGKFNNLSVDGVADAVAQALKLSRAGRDVFFACAEYLTPNSREATNAAGAYAFWLDIDCGEDKAAAGKGYPTVQDAEEALSRFCKDAGLPAAACTFTGCSMRRFHMTCGNRLQGG